MSNTFTLDAMRDSLEREFAPVEVDFPDGDKVVLRTLLRVPRRNREAAFKILTSIEDLAKGRDEDGGVSLEDNRKLSEAALELFPLISNTKEGGEKLVKAVEDDMALTLKLFETWMEATQPGEAERSEG